MQPKATRHAVECAVVNLHRATDDLHEAQLAICAKHSREELTHQEEDLYRKLGAIIDSLSAIQDKLE